MNDYGPREPAPVLPERYAQYSERIPRVVNTLLIAMGISNLFLLLSVGGASYLPNLGVNTLLMTFLLCFQNGLAWYIINNSSLPHNIRISPSEFHVGVVLGTCVGGALLSFVLSHYYGQLASCVSIATTSFNYQCNHRGKMLFIWFWAGVTFWLDLAIAILIVIGKEDVTFHANSQEYEDIGLNVDVNNTFRGFMPDTGEFFTSNSWGGHSAVGEAQTGENQHHHQQHHQQQQQQRQQSEYQPIQNIQAVSSVPSSSPGPHLTSV